LFDTVRTAQLQPPASDVTEPTRSRKARARGVPPSPVTMERPPRPTFALKRKAWGCVRIVRGNVANEGARTLVVGDLETKPQTLGYDHAEERARTGPL